MIVRWLLGLFVISSHQLGVRDLTPTDRNLDFRLEMIDTLKFVQGIVSSESKEYLFILGKVLLVALLISTPELFNYGSLSRTVVQNRE